MKAQMLILMIYFSSVPDFSYELKPLLKGMLSIFMFSSLLFLFAYIVHDVFIVFEYVLSLSVSVSVISTPTH